MSEYAVDLMGGNFARKKLKLWWEPCCLLIGCFRAVPFKMKVEIL